MAQLCFGFFQAAILSYCIYFVYISYVFCYILVYLLYSNPPQANHLWSLAMRAQAEQQKSHPARRDEGTSIRDEASGAKEDPKPPEPSAPPPPESEESPSHHDDEPLSPSPVEPPPPSEPVRKADNLITELQFMVAWGILHASAAASLARKQQTDYEVLGVLFRMSLAIWHGLESLER